MNRYERLKQLLGLDGGSFRSAGALVAVTPAESGLAVDTNTALGKINSSGYVKRTLAEADVYLHTIEAASSRYISDRHAFLGLSTLRNIAAEAAPGIAVITRHASGGGFIGNGENPYGRTFAGAVQTKDGVTRVLAQFYMLREHRPNGQSAPSTDDLDKGLVGGTLFDVSAGLKDGGTGQLVCDVCGFELFDSCTHFPGTTEGMTGGEIAKQQARGIPDGAATFTFENFHAKEISFVVDGAIEGAGTAFSTRTNKPAPNAHMEAEMYGKELKIKLGLAESATDAEVDAALAQLQTNAGKVASIEADRKRERDAAFKTKVEGKLTVEEIAMIETLPNRDQIADTLIAKSAKAAPPVGDPLKGTAGAAATTTNPGPAGELGECSEECREVIGTFKNNDELEKAVMTSPLGALQKFFGLKRMNTTSDMLAKDKRVLQARKRFFQITTVNV